MARRKKKKLSLPVLLLVVVLSIIVYVVDILTPVPKIIIDPGLRSFIENPINLLQKTDGNHQVIKRQAYTLSYNEEAEQANWVAYSLTDEMVIQGRAKRKDDFREDPKVKTGSADLSDYYQSGYDRGHLAPAGDMKKSKKIMSESFYMSNMSPQVQAFNRGVWRELEEQVREWAKQNEHLYIVTGPVLKGKMKTIGHNEVAVPNYYYKVIIDISLPEGKGIGFIMPNKSIKKNFERYAVTIDSVENFTGIDFFHQLPDSLERDLERMYYLRKWR